MMLFFFFCHYRQTKAMPWPTEFRTRWVTMMRWRNSWPAIPTKATWWVSRRTRFHRPQWRKPNSPASSPKLSVAEPPHPSQQTTPPPCLLHLPTTWQVPASSMGTRAPKSPVPPTGPEEHIVRAAARQLRRPAAESRAPADTNRNRVTRALVLRPPPHTPAGGTGNQPKCQLLSAHPASRTQVHLWPLLLWCPVVFLHQHSPRAYTANPAAEDSRNPQPMSGPWMARTRRPMTLLSSSPRWKSQTDTAERHLQTWWMAKAMQ